MSEGSACFPVWLLQSPVPKHPPPIPGCPGPGTGEVLSSARGIPLLGEACCHRLCSHLELALWGHYT